MRFIGNSTLFLLIVIAGPTVAMLGHAVDCGLFDIESTIRMCADGSRVSRYWTYGSWVASCLPAGILAMRICKWTWQTRTRKYNKYKEEYSQTGQ